jgi:hypothetical protein
MSKILFYIVITLCLSTYSQAQTSDLSSPKKHYSLVTSDKKISLAPFELALSASNLDQFRLYDQRRTIFFERNSVSVELFSAKELLENYGKQISPLTIQKDKDMIPVIFKLKEIDGKYSIEPIYQKK